VDQIAAVNGENRWKIHKIYLFNLICVERHGKRAAAIMSLIQSAKLNGHDHFLYLKDVLSRLPTQPNSRISELLPHRWQPQILA
jgi:hypothetical protein